MHTEKAGPSYSIVRNGKLKFPKWLVEFLKSECSGKFNGLAAAEINDSRYGDIVVLGPAYFSKDGQFRSKMFTEKFHPSKLDVDESGVVKVSQAWEDAIVGFDFDHNECLVTANILR